MYVFLNTRQPPFTSLKARQAINYAIDRDQIIQLLGLDSPAQATPTCQILPAGFPSYQRYCPYTAGAKDGAWHGPDLAKAVRLAHESGTTHVPVTVWNVRRATLSAPTSSICSDNWDTRPPCALCPLTSCSPRPAIPATRSSWASPAGLPDIPAPSDFFLPVLTCRSFYQDPASTDNLAEFCDPHADQLASEAQAAQQTDPAAARRLWAQVDRVVTDQAPWVPVFNRSETWFVSARVRNCQESPYYAGPLLDQMWVR